MQQRLYFLIPDRQQALDVVEELAKQGIGKNCMHAVGDQRTRLDGLPRASSRQNTGASERFERLLRNANLVGFALAIIAAITLPILFGLSLWLLLPGAIFGVNFLIGLYLSGRRDTHPFEFGDSLAHGEILLLVDVPPAQAEEVETRVHRLHPEATIGTGNMGTLPVGL
jgi:hypothetical protein